MYLNNYIIDIICDILLKSSTSEESSLDDKLPELVALHGSKTGVPLNFLHVVLGRDAFPSVTDRSLFYNTDAELKQAMKQSQDGVFWSQLKWSEFLKSEIRYTKILNHNMEPFEAIRNFPITSYFCFLLAGIATVHNQRKGLVAHHKHLPLCNMPLYLCWVGHLCQESRAAESRWCWWDLFGAAPATSPSSLC